MAPTRGRTSAEPTNEAATWWRCLCQAPNQKTRRLAQAPLRLLQLEGHGRQRRQVDEDGMFAAHPLSIFALHTAVIANIAATVRVGVGVDDLAIKSGARHAEAIVVPNDRRRVDHENDRFALARFAHERHDAVVGIVEIDPLEAFVRIVLLPERSEEHTSELQ